MAKTLKDIKEATNKKAAEKEKVVPVKKETAKVEPPEKEVAKKPIKEEKKVVEPIKEEENQEFEFETYWDQFSHSFKQRLVKKVDANS